MQREKASFGVDGRNRDPTAGDADRGAIGGEIGAGNFLNPLQQDVVGRQFHGAAGFQNLNPLLAEGRGGHAGDEYREAEMRRAHAIRSPWQIDRSAETIGQRDAEQAHPFRPFGDDGGGEPDGDADAEHRENRTAVGDVEDCQSDEGRNDVRDP